MQKIKAAFLILSLIIAAPAFAQTASGNAGIATSSPASFAYCPSLTAPLVLGSRDSLTNGQVTALQTFLSRRYSDQLVTGYFGSITRANVLRYQAEQGISAVGVVGPLTRAAIWRGCGTPGNDISAPQSYNFSADPASGPAPLQTTFTMGTSITNTASGQQYVVEFGDGAHDVMQKGSCIAITAMVGGQGGIRCSYTVSHTYASAGTYTATLSPYVACIYSNPRCMIATLPLGTTTVTVN